MTGRWRSSTCRKRYGNIISELGVDESSNQDSVNTAWVTPALYRLLENESVTKQILHGIIIVENTAYSWIAFPGDAHE